MMPTRCWRWRSHASAKRSATRGVGKCWTSDAEPAGTACGSSRRGARVTAVDFSAGMLEQARERAATGDVRFVTHDLHEPLPFGDASFDAVVSGLVLEHLRDLYAFLAEAHRVLRPDGRAVVSAMHPAMFLRGSQARFTDPVSGEIVMPGSLFHRIGEIIMAAVGAGFTLCGVGEYAPDAGFAARYPRAERYVGWPMLVVLDLRAGSDHAAGRR